MKKISESTRNRAREMLDSGEITNASSHVSLDAGQTWQKIDIWVDPVGETVEGRVLDRDGQTYTIEVETLSKASVTVRASSPAEALSWAKTIAAPQGLMVDEPTEYDWPTATVREHGKAVA